MMDESISDNSFYLNAVCSTPSALSHSDDLDDDLDFDLEISPEPVESKFDKTLAELEITKSMLNETRALLEHNKEEGTNKSGIADIYKDENNEIFSISISKLLLIKSELEAALELERETSVIEISDDFTVVNETVESSDCSFNDTVINALNDKTLTNMEENISQMANSVPLMKSPPEHVKALLKVSHSPLMDIMRHKNINFDICFEDKTQMEAAPSSSIQQTPTNYGIKRRLITPNVKFEKFYVKMLSKDLEPPRKLSKSQDSSDIKVPIRESRSDLTLQQNTFVEELIKEPVLYESEEVDEINKFKFVNSSLNLSQIPLPLDTVHHELRSEENVNSENEKFEVMETKRKEDRSLNLSQIPLPLDKEVHHELRSDENDYSENEKIKVIVTERKEDETGKNKDSLNSRKTYLSTLRSVDTVPERSPIETPMVEKLEQHPKTLKIILKSGELNILKDVSNKIQHVTYENKPNRQNECFNTEGASGIENLLTPKREPAFIESITNDNATKSKFSPVIFDLEQSKVTEVPSPIRVVRKRLPYVSNDPKENQDNCDPKWDILRLLETDEDRYKAVRLRWCNMTIPDPHADLTFRTKRHPTSRPQHSLLRNKNDNSNRRNIPLDVFYEEISQRIVRDSNRKMELLYKEDENTSQEMLGKHLWEQDEQFRRCRNMPQDNSEARQLYNRQMEESRSRKHYYENKKRLERESKYKLLAKLREIKAETEGFHTFYNGLSSTTALMISKTDLDNELLTDEMIHNYADFYKAPGASDNMDNSEKIPTLISRSIPNINTNNNFVPIINNNRYSVVIPDNINFTDNYNTNFNFFPPQYSLNNYHYYPSSFGGDNGLQMCDNNFFDINRRHVHDFNPAMSNYEHSFHDHTYMPNYYINNYRTYRGPFS